jgi:Pex2 / Pex12 amino terminal region
MEFFNDVGGDTLKPSIFELVAQEQLRDLLQPALKYVLSVSVLSVVSFCHLNQVTLQVFAQRFPRYLLPIVNRHEEFYALVMLFVEQHHLRRHS